MVGAAKLLRRDPLRGVILPLVVHLLLLVVAWFGWLMVDWAGAEIRSILLVATAAALLGVASWFVTRRWPFVVAPLAAACLFTLFTVVDVSPVQPAARAVQRNRVGMSESEVRAILESEFPARFRPAAMDQPLANGYINFVLGHDAHYNAAVVRVCFNHDRVVKAEFLAD